MPWILESLVLHTRRRKTSNRFKFPQRISESMSTFSWIHSKPGPKPESSHLWYACVFQLPKIKRQTLQAWSILLKASPKADAKIIPECQAEFPCYISKMLQPHFEISMTENLSVKKWTTAGGSTALILSCSFKRDPPCTQGFRYKFLGAKIWKCTHVISTILMRSW